MKIGQLITTLVNVMAQHGDLDVFLNSRANPNTDAQPEDKKSYCAYVPNIPDYMEKYVVIRTYKGSDE